MAALGINVSRDGRHTAEAVSALGATWVRIVLMKEHDLRARFAEYRTAGISILGVYVRESQAGFGTDADALAYYARTYGPALSALQVGNEPDLESPSSWTMTPDALARLGHQARAAFSCPIVGGGLASGQPSWALAADWSWADYLAVHPYLKDAPNPADVEDLTDVPVLLAGYRGVGLPLVVTEWGWWGTEEGRAVEEVSDMAAWASDTDEIALFCYFCADDAMVPPFGLMTAGGIYKRRAWSFVEQARTAPTVKLVRRAVEAPAPPAPAPAFDPWRVAGLDEIVSATGASAQNVAVYWPEIAKRLERAGCFDRPTVIAAIATVLVEVGGAFKPIHEHGDYAYFERMYGPGTSAGTQLGNVFAGDGARYHGRGHIQLTGRANYRNYGQILGVPLEELPDEALDPEVSAAVLVEYFTRRGIPSMARAGEWAAVRRAVNGGTNGLGQFLELVDKLERAIPHAPRAPIDPREQEIEGYRTAIRHLVDVTVRQAAAGVAQAEAAVAEADRIKRQFLGEAA